MVLFFGAGQHLRLSRPWCWAHILTLLGVDRCWRQRSVFLLVRPARYRGSNVESSKRGEDGGSGKMNALGFNLRRYYPIAAQRRLCPDGSDRYKSCQAAEVSPALRVEAAGLLTRIILRAGCGDVQHSGRLSSVLPPSVATIATPDASSFSAMPRLYLAQDALGRIS